MATNKQFAEESLLFKTACKLANVPATKRQASKFFARRGKAYQFEGAAHIELRREMEKVKAMETV